MCTGTRPLSIPSIGVATSARYRRWVGHQYGAPVDPSAVAIALAGVVDELPDGGDRREGQTAMADAVAKAIVGERHLIAQAGTGTGKTLAYLVPTVLSGKTTVVATATKALQDQLASKDLPFLHRHLSMPFTSTVLKGRSNYLCHQRLDELTNDDAQLELTGTADGRVSPRELEMLTEWADTTPTGDRADLDEEPSDLTWSAVSMSAAECPGAARCPRGDDCFAEDARQAAAASDVIIVNIHLYGAHLASGGMVLPDHEVLIVDEAHQLEDVVSDMCTLELSGGRFRHLAGRVGAVLTDEELRADLEAAGDRLTTALEPHIDRRFRSELPDDLVEAITLAASRVQRASEALRAVTSEAGDVKTRKDRALKMAGLLFEELSSSLELSADQVPWVEGRSREPVLRIAPLAVDVLLDEGVWQQRVGILTSATIPAGLGERVGLPPDKTDEMDAGSPFDFAANALLYCARDLPDPREAPFEPAMHDELADLIEAAGGRTLALFTSWRAMEAAAEVLAERLDTPVLVQGELPKPKLLKQFTADPATSLCATMSFWQGVDVPGPSLSLVTIDKLPFPRPDEPLLQARRELAREAGFATVDLPRAATLLAQGVGRLIRTAADQGAVAVFDRRLSRARYGWEIVNALPPMRRTRDRAEVVAYLKGLAAAEE
jgi:ATP-dependent DNA helicase DinG